MKTKYEIEYKGNLDDEWYHYRTFNSLTEAVQRLGTEAARHESLQHRLVAVEYEWVENKTELLTLKEQV